MQNGSDLRGLVGFDLITDRKSFRGTVGELTNKLLNPTFRFVRARRITPAMNFKPPFSRIGMKFVMMQNRSRHVTCLLREIDDESVSYARTISQGICRGEHSSRRRRNKAHRHRSTSADARLLPDKWISRFRRVHTITDPIRYPMFTFLD